MDGIDVWRFAIAFHYALLDLQTIFGDPELRHLADDVWDRKQIPWTARPVQDRFAKLVNEGRYTAEESAFLKQKLFIPETIENDPWNPK